MGATKVELDKDKLSYNDRNLKRVEGTNIYLRDDAKIAEDKKSVDAMQKKVLDISEKVISNNLEAQLAIERDLLASYPIDRIGDRRVYKSVNDSLGYASRESTLFAVHPISMMNRLKNLDSKRDSSNDAMRACKFYAENISSIINKCSDNTLIIVGSYVAMQRMIENILEDIEKKSVVIRNSVPWKEYGFFRKFGYTFAGIKYRAICHSKLNNLINELYNYNSEKDNIVLVANADTPIVVSEMFDKISLVQRKNVNDSDILLNFEFMYDIVNKRLRSGSNYRS